MITRGTNVAVSGEISTKIHSRIPVGIVVEISSKLLEKKYLYYISHGEI